MSSATVFTNKDDGTSLLNLVFSDLTGDGSDIRHFKKWWEVEMFYKSLKSNATLEKSPTRGVTTQNYHVFMPVYAVFKLE